MISAFICGVGWVTSAGIGWGQRGDDFILSAGPLPALARKDVFSEQNQRFGRMSDYAKLGLASIAFALRDAGLEGWSVKRPFGVVASTQAGSLTTDLEYQQTVLFEDGGMASPNLFAYTLANCFLGDTAIQFGLTGSLLAINDADPNGLSSFKIALEDLAMGETDTILAGVCDIPFPNGSINSGNNYPGAVFLVLSLSPHLRNNDYGSLILSSERELFHNDHSPADVNSLVKSVLSGVERSIPICDEKESEEPKLHGTIYQVQQDKF
jgi:3-oxoacyl-[acyl-carrier-protein] synthase II